MVRKFESKQAGYGKNDTEAIKRMFMSIAKPVKN